MVEVWLVEEVHAVPSPSAALVDLKIWFAMGNFEEYVRRRRRVLTGNTTITEDFEEYKRAEN